MGHSTGDADLGVIRETDNHDGGVPASDVAQSTVFAEDELIVVDGSTGPTHLPGPLIPIHIEGLWEAINGAEDVLAEDLPMLHADGETSCGHLWDDVGSETVWIHSPFGPVPGTTAVDTTPISVSPNINQPATAPYTEMEVVFHHHDEPTNDNGLAVNPGAPLTPASKRASAAVGYHPDTPQAPPLEEIAAPPEIPPAPPPIPCDVVCPPICAPNYLDTCPLTANYNLGSVTTQTALSHYQVQASAGYTKDEIVCNLKQLCETIIEPVRAAYPNVFITSAFRPGSGSSDHNKGFACDLQFYNWTYDQYWAAVQLLVANLPSYRQFILEYGRRPWFHISTSCDDEKRQVLTRVRPGKYVPGLVRVR
jgi:hypothetical protein